VISSVSLIIAGFRAVGVHEKRGPIGHMQMAAAARVDEN